jgi:hypothetical protein
MRRFCVTVSIFSLGLLLSGCGSRDDGDRLYPLTGAATFNGEPIDLGAITLIPMGGGGVNMRNSGGVIKDGRYAIPEERGPHAGTYRVEVHWLKMTGRKLRDEVTGDMYDERVEALPAQFHKNSDLTIEIPAPEDTHDLILKAG